MNLATTLRAATAATATRTAARLTVRHFSGRIGGLRAPHDNPTPTSPAVSATDAAPDAVSPPAAGPAPDLDCLVRHEASFEHRLATFSQLGQGRTPRQTTQRGAEGAAQLEIAARFCLDQDDLPAMPAALASWAEVSGDAYSSSAGAERAGERYSLYARAPDLWDTRHLQPGMMPGGIRVTLARATKNWPPEPRLSDDLWGDSEVWVHSHPIPAWLPTPLQELYGWGGDQEPCAEENIIRCPGFVEAQGATAWLREATDAAIEAGEVDAEIAQMVFGIAPIQERIEAADFVRFVAGGTWPAGVIGAVALHDGPYHLAGALHAMSPTVAQRTIEVSRFLASAHDTVRAAWDAGRKDTIGLLMRCENLVDKYVELLDSFTYNLPKVLTLDVYSSEQEFFARQLTDGLWFLLGAGTTRWHPGEPEEDWFRAYREPLTPRGWVEHKLCLHERDDDEITLAGTLLDEAEAKIPCPAAAPWEDRESGVKLQYAAFKPGPRLEALAEVASHFPGMASGSE